MLAVGIVYLDLIAFMCAKLFRSCPILSDPMDSSLPGSSVHGILQTRILTWIAMPSSRGSSQPRDQTSVSHVYCTGQWVLYHYHQLLLLPPLLLLSPFSCVRLCVTPRRQPTRLPRPWDSPGKNTGAGCHFLLQ